VDRDVSSLLLNHLPPHRCQMETTWESNVNTEFRRVNCHFIGPAPAFTRPRPRQGADLGTLLLLNARVIPIAVDATDAFVTVVALAPPTQNIER
jgi:hypothetical protein